MWKNIRTVRGAGPHFKNQSAGDHINLIIGHFITQKECHQIQLVIKIINQSIERLAIVIRKKILRLRLKIKIAIDQIFGDRTSFPIFLDPDLLSLKEPNNL